MGLVIPIGVGIGIGLVISTSHERLVTISLTKHHELFARVNRGGSK